MTYYKWLRADRSAPTGRGKWAQGRWKSVKGDIIPCENGLHLCRPRDLLNHVSERLWTAEIDPTDLIECDDKIVVRRARIIAPVETITYCTLRLFACDCAERVVHLAKDGRCHDAVAVARRFARGQASKDELDAARDAASAAAWAASNIAWGATRDAALGRHESDAASAVADAAGAAALGRRERAAAWAAERAAQTARFLQYIQHGEAAEAMPWPR